MIRNTRLTRQVADQRLVPLDDNSIEQFVTSSLAPEFALLRSKYRSAIEQALRTALTSLRRRDRCVLRLTLIKRVSLRKVGDLYGVDPSTVWHWLEKIRRQLREEIELHLQSCGLPAGELGSIMRALASQIDVGTSAWGRSDPAGQAKH